jgi:hypothetical protein
MATPQVEALSGMTPLGLPEETKARHGSCFDRGSADSYYGRPRRPHYYVGDTYTSPKVTVENMTEEEIANYNAGYDWNESNGDKKDWG